MTKAGCRILADPTRHSAMLLGAARQVGFWLRLLKEIRRQLETERPAVVIPIDSPPVNLRVARAARDLKIPVCYYVAPQLWAWAPWRINKVRARTDTLCCVLPFEEEYFRNRGVNAVYVGHPIFESKPSGDVLTPPLPTGNIKIALFPGSRRSEIDANLPVMLRSIIVAQGRHPGTVFAAAAADSDRLWQIRQEARKASVKIDIRAGCADDIIRWADLVLTVSGTATLQIARYHKPMIIIYAVAGWKWNLAGRYLIQTKYMSLVNILANRELTPEFMPFYGSPDPVVNRLLDLIAHASQRQEISRQLSELTSPMLTFAKARSPSKRVVDEIRKLMPACNLTRTY
jgi:lipid-A-disaccharide synthase